MPQAGTSRQSLADLAARSGTAVPCEGNLPVKLDDPDSAWFIERGAVNLFVVEFQDGSERAAPQHLLRRESGWLLPGVAPDTGEAGEGTSLSIVAKGLPGTLLKRLPASALAEVHPAELADQIDTWLGAFTDTLSRFAGRLPPPTALAEPGTTRALDPCVLSVRRDVVWVSGLPGGSGTYMDIVDPTEVFDAQGLDAAAIPLTRTSWLTLYDEATVRGQATEALAAQGMVQPALAAFHAVAFALERLNRRLAVVDEANLDRARTMSRRTAEQAARRRLFNVYDRPLDRDAHVEATALADALGHHWPPPRHRIPGSETPGVGGFPARPRRHPRCVGGARPPRALPGRRRMVARRQQRAACVSGRHRPARRPAARPVRALPGDRSGEQAQRPGYRASCRRVERRSLDVLSTVAVRRCQADRPAAHGAARIRARRGATRPRRVCRVA